MQECRADKISTPIHSPSPFSVGNFVSYWRKLICLTGRCFLNSELESRFHHFNSYQYLGTHVEDGGGGEKSRDPCKSNLGTLPWKIT